jgi:hypothetical protein
MGWIGPVTHRQYLAWQEWLDEQWDCPDRTDHYLMSIAAEVRRGNAKNPRQVEVDHLRLKFKTAQTSSKRQSTGGPHDVSLSSREHRRNLALVSKAVWLSRMTMVPDVVEESDDG